MIWKKAEVEGAEKSLGLHQERASLDQRYRPVPKLVFLYRLWTGTLYKSSAHAIQTLARPVRCKCVKEYGTCTYGTVGGGGGALCLDVWSARDGGGIDGVWARR